MALKRKPAVGGKKAVRGAAAVRAVAKKPVPRPRVRRAAPEPTVEELLRKADQPAKDSLRLHEFYRGVWEVVPKACIRSLDDFAIWYTPGVAATCKDIQANPEKVLRATNKWNTIAVVSDGTRILGLGNIGPEAGLPVMEGKALLFKYLGGVDAVPLCIECHKTEEIVTAVKWLQPSFSGINLEDIEKPKCFDILDRLRAEARIPVWHDDQQGTAAVTVAGWINALKIVGKNRDRVRIALIGAGASNINICRMMIAAGADPLKICLVDTKGILSKSRTDVRETEPVKWHFANITNGEQRSGGIAEAMEGADVCVALSSPGPGKIKPEWVRKMAKDAILFACANPIPEIWPWEAKDAGARIVATGRSDFPNQVNNSLGFPGIFRGTLDVMATTITDEMCIAAAEELARTQADKGMDEEHLIPTMDDWEVFPREAVAVGLKAIEQGIARRKADHDTLFAEAATIIRRARKQVQVLQEKGVIRRAPGNL
ncbi:MAG: NADP-dependent malic enzyme [Deltaproteobacteria bacterium]|nr:NADP-dependent malic enzyme [Deltaproteobacteria bacterium]